MRAGPRASSPKPFARFPRTADCDSLPSVERTEAESVGREGGTTWRTIALVVMGLAGAVTLVMLIVTLGHANRQRDRALDLQQHSYDVMILARTLAGTIARSEASLGRYVISGDRQLGQLYFDEWTLARSQIDRLEHITYDNPQQRPLIDRLRDAYDTRGEELSAIALATTYNKNSLAYARYYQARQASSLARITGTLDGIIRSERALLAERTADASGSVARSSRIAGGLAGFGILIVAGAIVLGWMTVQAVGERAAARADAEAARARAEELATAVDEATAELKVQEAKLRQAQKMDAVGQLTGGIAHDFNNMLAVVLGGLELARRAAPGDHAALQRHIDSATEGANRAAALTRQLLAFSREESLKPQAILPAALVAGMTDLLDRTLGDAIELIVDDRTTGWRVHADRVQLENAILNLAVNARDAMDGRGILTITSGEITLAEGAVGQCVAGDYAVLSVTDTGSGMTPEVAERVFEPFFTTKPVGKGTGLGLSQIFGLVGQLGGDVALRTAPGAGTTVTLYLPRDRSAAPAALPVEPAAPAPMHPAALSVLVVEDDPRVLAATMGALEELGHHALPCDDPLAAPAMLAANPDIQLVISDVLMPRQTGPEMIAGLAGRFPDLAVLFVTGFAGEANAAVFGDHELLRKPFTLAGLERGIAAAMARAAHRLPSSIAAE